MPSGRPVFNVWLKTWTWQNINYYQNYLFEAENVHTAFP